MLSPEHLYDCANCNMARDNYKTSKACGFLTQCAYTHLKPRPPESVTKLINTIRLIHCVELYDPYATYPAWEFTRVPRPNQLVYLDNS